MDKQITVGLVEDQLLFRQGMVAILSTWDNINVIFESPDGYSVIDKLKQCDTLPDVLLVDLTLPPHPVTKQDYSGVHVVKAVRELFPSIKIIMLSVHDDDNFIAQTIEHGAHGYLVKDSDPQEVYDAISFVHNKGSYFNERTLKAVQHSMQNKTKETQMDKPKLSKRELEVLQLICKEHSTEQIAEQLFISKKTVDGHRIKLLQKIGANNVAGLVMYAIKNELVQ